MTGVQPSAGPGNKNTIADMEYQHRSYQGVLFDVYF